MLNNAWSAPRSSKAPDARSGPAQAQVSVLVDTASVGANT